MPERWGLISGLSVLIWNVLVYTLVVTLRRRGPLRAARIAHRGQRPPGYGLPPDEERPTENRRIIAALTSRIPELEAPAWPELPKATETTTEQPGRFPQTTIEVAQEGPERLSWWRRMFGG